MPRSLFLLCLLWLVPLLGSGQRVLLKPANYPPDAVADSVQRFIRSLKPHDFRFVVLRAYDNGFYWENAQVGTVVWRTAGQWSAKTFVAGARGTVPVPRLPLDTLHAFYVRHGLAQLAAPVPPAKDGPAQGPSYSVDVAVSTLRESHTEGFNVRAPARQAQRRVAGSPARLEADPRCAWLDLWEQVLP